MFAQRAMATGLTGK